MKMLWEFVKAVITVAVVGVVTYVVIGAFCWRQEMIGLGLVVGGWLWRTALEIAFFALVYWLAVGIIADGVAREDGTA